MPPFTADPYLDGSERPCFAYYSAMRIEKKRHKPFSYCPGALECLLRLAEAALGTLMTMVEPLPAPGASSDGGLAPVSSVAVTVAPQSVAVLNAWSSLIMWLWWLCQ